MRPHPRSASSEEDPDALVVLDEGHRHSSRPTRLNSDRDAVEGGEGSGDRRLQGAVHRDVLPREARPVRGGGAMRQFAGPLDRPQFSRPCAPISWPTSQEPDPRRATSPLTDEMLDMFVSYYSPPERKAS